MKPTINDTKAANGFKCHYGLNAYQDEFIHFSLFLPCYFKLLQLVRCLSYNSAALHIICSYSYKYSNTPNTKQKIQLATITSILTLNLYFPTTDTFSTVQQWTTAKQSIFNRLYSTCSLHFTVAL